MRKTEFIFGLLLIAVLGSITIAQQRDFKETGGQRKPASGRQISIYRHLGLSQEQIQQIRQINRATRPKRHSAAQQFQLTKKELDDAIYADNLDNAAVETKLKSFLEAQARLSKISRMNEVAVRAVLTNDQLLEFRKLRRRFANAQKRRGRQRIDRRNRQTDRRTRRPQRQRP